MSPFPPIAGRSSSGARSTRSRSAVYAAAGPVGLLINFHAAPIEEGITRIVNRLEEVSLAKSPGRQEHLYPIEKPKLWDFPPRRFEAEDLATPSPRVSRDRRCTPWRRNRASGWLRSSQYRPGVSPSREGGRDPLREFGRTLIRGVPLLSDSGPGSRAWRLLTPLPLARGSLRLVILALARQAELYR